MRVTGKKTFTITKPDATQYKTHRFNDIHIILVKVHPFFRLVDQHLILVIRQYAEARKNDWLSNSLNTCLQLHDHVDIKGEGVFKGWKVFQLYANG